MPLNGSNCFFQNDINVGETGFTLQTVDKTMKFVTSTIQGVRKWNEYRDQIPLVFEIFGKHANYIISNCDSKESILKLCCNCVSNLNIDFGDGKKELTPKKLTDILQPQS